MHVEGVRWARRSLSGCASDRQAVFRLGCVEREAGCACWCKSEHVFRFGVGGALRPRLPEWVPWRCRGGCRCRRCWCVDPWRARCWCRGETTSGFEHSAPFLQRSKRHAASLNAIVDVLLRREDEVSRTEARALHDMLVETAARLRAGLSL